MNRSKQLLRYLLGVAFIAAGALHFIAPDVYVQIMPPFFTFPRFWVFLSGALELLGGVGLLLRRFQRASAYALALLMVAFFPVHVYMLVYPAEYSAVVGAAGIAPYLLFWRLALQFALIALFVWLAEDVGD